MPSARTVSTAIPTVPFTPSKPASTCSAGRGLSPSIVDDLFLSGQNNDWQDDGLPFLQKREDGSMCYWAEPPIGNLDENTFMANSEDFGKRSAAAYFIHVSRTGLRGVTLAAIVHDMPNPPSYACQNFFHYLQRLLWFYGQHVSAVQVATDVEMTIAENRQLTFGES